MSTQNSSAGKQVAVVGAGIAGLAAAFHLQKAGCRVDLIERDQLLGGRMGLDRLGDRRVMMGGKNMGKKYSAIREFLADLGNPRLEPFGINTSRVIDGKLLTYDSDQTVLGRLQRLRQMAAVSDLGKTASLALRVRSKEENRFLGSETFTKLGARNDHKPLSEHFGPAIQRNMFRAVTVRMNGAEPDEVYLGTFGTNLGMLMDTYDQLTDGIAPVIDALGERVSVLANSSVEGLIVRDGRVSGLEVSENGGPVRERDYDGVVLAAPAHAAADIVKGTMAELSNLLMNVRYFPAAVALVEYDRPFFTSDVRAILLDDGPCSNVGAYGVDDLHIARYTFSGRAARSGLSEGRLDEWIDDAEARVKGLLGIGQIERVRSVSKVWDAAYCAYLPYHGEFLKNVRAEVRDAPGLELAGDYMRGAPIEAAFRSGAEAARRLVGTR
ncbi:FAD-dependent oxidoreductase [Nocardia sp. BMG51109]|uniref:FAD-dependent oxidoreductase n=1 Tax=Nocardia sp. BMG51109 TaxID=1056816 RepID=UPI0004653D66|nr:FAD-dependent oxidoreductase [Nocardia sp. BMG51109]